MSTSSSPLGQRNLTCKRSKVLPCDRICIHSWAYWLGAWCNLYCRMHPFGRFAVCWRRSLEIARLQAFLEFLWCCQSTTNPVLMFLNSRRPWISVPAEAFWVCSTATSARYTRQICHHVLAIWPWSIWCCVQSALADLFQESRMESSSSVIFSADFIWAYATVNMLMYHMSPLSDLLALWAL